MPSAGYYTFLFVSLLLARPLIACLYAAAQSLTALLLAPDNQVRTYLGGYGDAAPTWGRKWGRFELWVSWQLLYWPASFCDFAAGKPVSYGRQLLILLAGPASVLALAAGALGLLLLQDTWGLVRFASALLIFLAAFHLLRVLLTRIDAVPLAGGGLVLGDGERLALLLRYRKAAPAVQQALWHWEKEEFAEVARCIDSVLAAGHQHKDLYEYAIYSHLLVGDAPRARTLHTTMASRHRPDAGDLTHLAFMHLQAGEQESARSVLDQALALTPGYHVALSQRGWLHLQLADRAAARADLDRAIRWEPEFAYAHAHRGWLHLQEGDLEQAQVDLMEALKIDPLHNRAYLHLGWVHQGRGDLDARDRAWHTARILAVPETAFQDLPPQSPRT